MGKTSSVTRVPVSSIEYQITPTKASRRIPLPNWKTLLGVVILLQALTLGIYLGRAGQLGFPLDDAWIHQTYARNLGLHGVMAFLPGRPSTGSTSFGWTLLLAVGYRLGIPFFGWTYLWGGLFGIATAFMAARLSQMYFGKYRNAAVVGILCILEWHLAWASVSGMEISLFAFLTLVFFLLNQGGSSPAILGGLAGMIVLVRPEGILLGLVYAVSSSLRRRDDLKHTLLDVGIFLLFFSLIISPWVMFNWVYSNRPFPNTISAKFMQYGYPWSLWKSLKYVWDMFVYFLNGPLMLLLPGAAFTIYQMGKSKVMSHFFPYAWTASLIGLYAVALPVIYDHGRYLMPLIPLVIIYGVEGLDELTTRFVHSFALRFTVWAAMFGMVILLWVNGASDYAYRIRLFEIVHLRAADWINRNLPQDTVLATHDVGILGYFTERPMVDLAGLITPEIGPILRDPPQLAEYLRQNQVTHLILYSGYYPELLSLLHAQVVFSPGAEQLRALGVEPFEIYEVRGQ